jgi:radical SAM protein with 4Fe4S-binding SPASM domain
MRWEIFKKVIDEISQFNDTVLRFACDGEPMCHPEFLDMLVYTKEKNISQVTVITNGFFLHRKAAQKILECNTDVVEISLDAINKDTYLRVRNGSDFGLVMDNVHRLIKIRDEMNSNTMIFVSIIDQPIIKEELRKFKDYWQGRADKVIIRPYTTVGGLIDIAQQQHDNKTQERWPCPLLFKRTFINPEGLVKFCVEDWLDKTVMGDVKTETIQDIWHSDEYQNLRQLHLSERFNQIPYCKACLDWDKRDWNYDYFYALNETSEREKV